MKKINQAAWVVLATLSFIVGTWALIAEGPLHSKFLIFYGFSLSIGVWFFLKRKFLLKNAKPKKRR